MFFDEEFEEDDTKKLNMTIAKTMLLHAVFILPIAYIFFFSPNRVFHINPYAWISVIVHEFGHFLFRTIGASQYLHVLGGTLFEYLVPSLLVLLCAKSKRSAVLALIFIACIGSDLPYTANYMESASSPHGYSYLSNTPMSKANHDWYFLLSRWGMLGEEHTLGLLLRAAGDVLMLIGIAGSTAGLIFLIKQKPLPFAHLLLIGTSVALIWFLIKGRAIQLGFSEYSFAAAIFIFSAQWLYENRGKFKGIWK